MITLELIPKIIIHLKQINKKDLKNLDWTSMRSRHYPSELDDEFFPA
jgi:hypothetical protein